MDFLISSAYAQAAGAGSPQSPLMTFLPIVVLFVAFYFLLIRPQTKKAKEHREMVAKLAVGDEVVTAGGILGRVTEAGETFVSVEIAKDVTIKVQRVQVSQLMPKGTFKSA
ncbi:MAG TPA: preprotein translocase subunit YajC [Steroidobacteraceae bacterium]|nr:preprotein translocase subunit YajC [Steroidobacteraceae bacterium]